MNISLLAFLEFFSLAKKQIFGLFSAFLQNVKTAVSPQFLTKQAVKGLQVWSRVQLTMFCHKISYVPSYMRNGGGI